MGRFFLNLVKNLMENFKKFLKFIWILLFLGSPCTTLQIVSKNIEVQCNEKIVSGSDLGHVLVTLPLFPVT